ncbi:hypothetical protein HMPREF3150_04218 [Pseudomonas aeruginosa]|nr:hypothetical protein HMPREF3150_04218 [Pseudomonas aeruginosa]
MRGRSGNDMAGLPGGCRTMQPQARAADQPLPAGSELACG